MAVLPEFGKTELKELIGLLAEQFETYKAEGYKFDMSRGKPCSIQLDLSDRLNDCLSTGGYLTADNVDCRNYGNPEGIPEARRLFAGMLEAEPDEMIIGGNSSLNMMYDSVIRALQCGVSEDGKSWSSQGIVKFLCPSPGYDRHFAICESLGIKMMPIEMRHEGPDMDTIESLAESDESIKGIWCVPLYSNPDGITYSDNIVTRLASFKAKANDFRIFWDNAYAVHHLYEEKGRQDKVANIMEACKAAGNEDRPYIFSSTSKITYPGAGIAMMAASKRNVAFILKHLTKQTICPDKMNQLRHVRFLKDMEGITAQMKKHAAILRPKFDAVFEIFERELGNKGIASWNKPNGGYFISLNILDGCAKKAVLLAREAGVVLTGAGATYPYGIDPYDRNIRIAPTYPPMDELKKALKIVCVCIKIACAEKQLAVILNK